MAIDTEQLGGTKQHSFETPVDRPNGRSIYVATEAFYMAHLDLLQQGHGLVYEPKPELYPAHNVFFDATKSHIHMLSWGHSTIWTERPRLGDSVQLFRTVREFGVLPGGRMEGWQTHYTSEGHRYGTRDLEESECTDEWLRVTGLINSLEMQSQVEILRTAGEKTARKVGFAALSLESKPQTTFQPPLFHIMTVARNGTRQTTFGNHASVGRSFGVSQLQLEGLSLPHHEFDEHGSYKEMRSNQSN